MSRSCFLHAVPNFGLPLCHSEEHSDEEPVILMQSKRIRPLGICDAPLRMTNRQAGIYNSTCNVYQKMVYLAKI